MTHAKEPKEPPRAYIEAHLTGVHLFYESEGYIRLGGYIGGDTLNLNVVSAYCLSQEDTEGEHFQVSLRQLTAVLNKLKAALA